jgi:Uncharacterised nucleotidyltransferase
MADIELPRFSPELALVAACSRWPFRAGEEQEVRNRVATGIDWNLFLAWIRRNRVAPLVYRNLQQALGPSIPEALMLELQSECKRHALRSLRQISEAVRMTGLLAAAGIRSMVVKGPTLAELAFGNPMLRESEDIDFLIDPARLREADRVITQAGYRRIVPQVEMTASQHEVYRRRRCQFSYYSETHGIFLELHWRLTSNPFLMPTDAASLWNRSQQIRMSGVNVSTLPDEYLLLYLCVHASVHMWFRLKWLADIAALLQQLLPEAIEQIAKQARALEVDRSFHQAVILAHGLMGAAVPSRVLTDACCDDTARRLAIAGCRALNWHGSPEEPIKSQWFSVWVNWNAFRLRPGLRFRWKELQNQMFSPEDWARVQLPQRLSMLYLPLRPLSWVSRHVHRLVTR